MDGLSSSYSMRNLMGRHYLEHLWVFLSAEAALSVPGFQREGFVSGAFHNWFARQQELTAAVLNVLGVTWRPRLARAVFSPPVATLDGALGASRSKRVALAELHRIAPCRARPRRDSQRNNSATATAYAALPAVAPFDAAGIRRRRVAAADQPWTVAARRMRREPELVESAAGQLTQTVWDQMATKISVHGRGGSDEVGEYLLGFTPIRRTRRDERT